MLTSFGLDYFFLCLAASFGALQFAAAYSRLYGLLVFNRSFSAFLGLAVMILAFTWFFATEPRNIPDTGEGLDGNQQAILFSTAAATSLVITLFGTSLRHCSMSHEGSSPNGMDALRSTTYFKALMKGRHGFWKRFSLSTKKPSSGSTAG